MNKTLCELFAGVGGFRIGLERADSDWQTVWMNQWEPSRKKQDAFQCYCKHFGYKDIYINEDISTIDKLSIPNHTLLVAGFPCQDYSVASVNAKGIDGKKGVLWWQIYDIIKIKKPKFLLLENVDRLLKSPASQRGRDFCIMLSCLFNLDYAVEWRVVNAADYGFPQRRKRIFIFAYHKTTNFYKQMKENDSSNIINSVGFFAKSFTIYPIQKTKIVDISKRDLFDISNKFSFNFESGGYMCEGVIYTAKITPKYQGSYVVLRDILDKNVSDKYFIDNLEKWKYLKGAKKEERIAKNGHRYKYSEGAIPFPDSIDIPSRTILTSESSVNRCSHVIKDPNTNRLRILTPNETNKLQGFPEHWTDTGMSEKFQYFCMGNAVIVGCVEKMGYTLKEIFEGEY